MLALLPLLLPMLGDLLKRVIPDPEQAASAQLELAKALGDRDSEIAKAFAEAAKTQTDINLAEASNPSLFVSGWRPAVGWCCVVGCAYGFVGQPLLAWLTGISGVALGAAIPAPPVLDMGTLLGLLGGLLGLGTLRTVEKVQGVERQNLKGRAP